MRKVLTNPMLFDFKICKLNKNKMVLPRKIMKLIDQRYSVEEVRGIKKIATKIIALKIPGIILAEEQSEPSFCTYTVYAIASSISLSLFLSSELGFLQ